MKKLLMNRLLLMIVIVFIGFGSIANAAETPQTYGEAVSKKLTRGVANIFSAPLEIPKNVINATNATINPDYYESNIFFGVLGGGLKGLMTALGRLAVGVTDLVTFPLPTKEITRPNLIWDDFDADTTFGPVFRLEDYTVASTQRSDPYEYESGDDTAAREQARQDADAASSAAAEAAKARAAEADAETNKKIDQMFEKTMQK